MQVLKDEIRTAILDAAQRQFLAVGYEKASIGQIARLAGISKSNLYHYFTGKEEIFYQLTDSAAHKLQDLINFFTAMQSDLCSGHDALPSMIIEQVYPLMAGEWAPLLLLLQSADGTRYAALGEELTTMFAQNITLRSPGCFPPLAARLIAQNLVRSISEILRYASSVEEIHSNMLLLARYHSGGMLALFQ